MNILVTGGAGFIGSNFIRYMFNKYNYNIINLDLLTYSGNPKNLEDILYNKEYHNEKENIELVKLILDHLNKGEDLITYVGDRLGHDRRYAIDNRKIATELGWTPLYSFEDGIKETIDWYLDNLAWMEDIVSGQYASYYKKMYGEISK